MDPLKSPRFSIPSTLSSSSDDRLSGHLGYRGGSAPSASDVVESRCTQPAAPGQRTSAIDPFLGSSAVIERLRDFSQRVADSDTPAVILGETGSGKGVLANWLHANGKRRHEQFLDLNCAGLDREFLETELFGHEKGAFTSAVAAKPGLLEIANHGTVFLDEIGDVDMRVQPKLLKVLETGRFRRLGDVRDRFADVRLISATHRDLGRDVREGRFRSDLFYRINIVVLEVPALRCRTEDIPYLAEELLRSLAGRNEAIALNRSAMSALQRYSWPGNIRELRNVLQRALLVADQAVITERELQFFPTQLEEPPTCLRQAADLTLQEMEKNHIAAVLALELGSIQKAAKRLGIPRSSLYNKVNRFGICNGKN